MKFVGGALCYLVTVILVEWQTLEDADADEVFKYYTLVFGISSMMMVFGTTFLLMRDNRMAGHTPEKF